MSFLKCLKCDDVLVPEKEISCDLCRRYIHSTCSDLSRTEIQCLRVKERKLIYYCSSCSDFKSQLATLTKLKETVARLEEEVKSLKDAESVDINGAADCVANPDISQVINELQDRQSRESNVLIFNLEETNAADHLERTRAVSAKLFDVIHSIDDSIDVSNIKFFRLGKYVEGRIRPLKVTLSSKADALTLLKNKKRISGNLRIRSDLTPMQQQHLRDLRTKLQDLNDGGGNKTIKYIKGVPQIVDAKN